MARWKQVSRQPRKAGRLGLAGLAPKQPMPTRWEHPKPPRRNLRGAFGAVTGLFTGGGPYGRSK